VARKNENRQNTHRNKYHGTEELFLIQNYLTNYTEHIVEKFFVNFKINSKSIICDFGAGTGFLAELFEKLYDISPKCVEIDEELISIIRSKNLTCVRKLSDLDDRLDAIYSSNVLEHIENDVEILKQMHDTLKPNGKLGLFVPAFMFLFSDMDRKVGHHRRYSKRVLKNKLIEAKFKNIKFEYVDSLGLFASILILLFGWKNKMNIGGKISLQIYDRLIFPMSKFIDKVGFKFICGKNLFVVVERGDTDDLQNTGNYSMS